MERMRILVFLISLLLLLAVSAFADINGQVDSLRTMAFEQSLVPDAGNSLIDTDYGNRVVNRAIQQVCHDFPAYEKTDTVVSVAGTIEYALNTDFLRLKTILKMTTFMDLKIVYGLSFPPIETWFEAKAGLPGGEPDPNEKAEPRYASTWNDKVYFYPTPSQPDSFIVTYYAIDSQIITATNSTSVLPEYREAIILFAASLICYRKGDFVRAKEYMALYNAKLQLSITVREPQKKQ